MFTKINIWFLLFLLWGLPLSYYRSSFRKVVYETSSWTINIKPVFLREIKALTGYYSTGNPDFPKALKFYRIYLSVYLLLFMAQVFL